MNEFRQDKEELEFSDRYNQGFHQGRNPEEESAFASYRFIHKELRNHSIPDVDEASIIQRMISEMKSNAPVQAVGSIDQKKWFWKPVMAAAAVLCLILALGVIAQPHPVIKVQWFASDSADKVSWWWNFRLQWGIKTDCPDGISAQLLLEDGSILSCTPGSRLAVRYGSNRHITLDRGSITVQAAKNASWPMIVGTPLGNVKVLGTTFIVDIIQ